MSATDLPAIRAIVTAATFTDGPGHPRTCPCDACVVAWEHNRGMSIARDELVKVVPGLLEEVERLAAEKAELLAANEKITKERDEALADAYDTVEELPVCPGCHAVGPDPCVPGCIDDEIRQEREEAMERDENGEIEEP